MARGLAAQVLLHMGGEGNALLPGIGHGVHRKGKPGPGALLAVDAAKPALQGTHIQRPFAIGLRPPHKGL